MSPCQILDESVGAGKEKKDTFRDLFCGASSGANEEAANLAQVDLVSCKILASDWPRALHAECTSPSELDIPGSHIRTLREMVIHSGYRARFVDDTVFSLFPLSSPRFA